MEISAMSRVEWIATASKGICAWRNGISPYGCMTSKIDRNETKRATQVLKPNQAEPADDLNPIHHHGAVCH
jgi:hypothetical protein